MRLRPDAAAEALDADRLLVTHPDGRRWVHHLPGAAAATAANLRSGSLTGLESQFEEQGLAWDGPTDASRLLLHRQWPARLPMREGVVRIRGHGRVAHWLHESLLEFGVPAASDEMAEVDSRQDLVVYASDGLDVPALLAANRSAIDLGVPFLAACGWEARRILVGPLVVPGETACAECWMQRRRQNTWMPDPEGKASVPTSPQSPPSELAFRMAGSLAALEAAKFQQGALPATLGAVVTLGLDTLESIRDEVVRAPRCPACTRHRAHPPVQAWLPVPREGSPSSS